MQAKQYWENLQKVSVEKTKSVAPEKIHYLRYLCYVGFVKHHGGNDISIFSYLFWPTIIMAHTVGQGC